MARMARAVVPGLPHLVSQNGVRGMDIFRDDADRRLYLRLMKEEGDHAGVKFLAWCLTPKRVLLVAVPRREESLARGIGKAHKRYTREVNRSEGVRGHLFEGRFMSCALEGANLPGAARHVELVPVRSGAASAAGRWKWSSAAYHLRRQKDDPLVPKGGEGRTLGGLVRDWQKLLARKGGKAADQVADEAEARQFERHLSTGRPLGAEAFVKRLEKRLGRKLLPGKPGWPKGKKRKKRKKPVRKKGKARR